MTMRAASAKTLPWPHISFLLSNRIPHQLANRFFGWFSQIEAPLLARVSIAIWRLFADLDLSESQTQRFTSLHACFTRALKPGARPVDPDPHILISPCDGIIGACGRIDGNELIQAKGAPYRWNGYNTGRPSSYLHQRASPFAARCSRVRSSAWEGR